jgi:co-chaperonin GroES (HSP10)
MELTLLDDRVLVRLEPWTRMTKSGLLHLPDMVKRAEYELWKGTVVSTGPGQLRHDGLRNPVDVHEGDRVVFYWAAAELDVTKFFEGAEEFRVISEKSIQAVLE